MVGIKTENLTKVYRGKRRAKVLALDQLDLEVLAGEVFGFLGPNGAGKSTTIKLLMGLIRPTSGNATILGQSVNTYNARKRVGYLPENPSFYDFLTALEYVQFVAGVHGLKGKYLAERSEEVLSRLGLWNERKRSLRSYSKGMVQRLGLAQVLVHDPDVYILDEPMSGLDPLGRSLVKEIILDLRSRGKCVFFSTHITADVESVCDRIAIIKGGRLRTVRKVEDILTEGLKGYEVQWRHKEGEVKESSIGEDELTSFLQGVEDSGGKLLLVEPKRKHVEKFFLEVIQGEK